MSDAIPPCPSDESHTVVRFGTRERADGQVTQLFWCKQCERKFRAGEFYDGGRYPIRRIVETLTHYYNGQSYGNVAQTFNDLNREHISKKTLWQWVLGFSQLGSLYAKALKPTLGRTWIADETAIFIDGEQWWFWDMIDEKTRFLIASHLSKTRGILRAERLMMLAASRSGVAPKEIRTDALKDYIKAVKNVFGSATHLVSHGFDSATNTNMIERFHGTIKQRTKVMRHFKIPECASVVLDGFMTHYNFLKEHDALSRMTPASAAGIDVGIGNWGDLIAGGMEILEGGKRKGGGHERVVAANPERFELLDKIRNLNPQEWGS